MADRIVLNTISYHGHGAIENIVPELTARGYKKAFVCSDPDLLKFGVTKKVTDLLDAAGFAYTVYSEIKPNPTIANVQDGVAAFKAAEADCIVTIGGGSSMDTAKAIGIIINNPEFADVRSLEGVAPTKKHAVFTIAVPTTAGTAAEVTITPKANTTDERRESKITITAGDAEFGENTAEEIIELVQAPYMPKDTHTEGYVFFSDDFQWIPDNWVSPYTKYGWPSVSIDGTNGNEFALSTDGMKEAVAAKGYTYTPSVYARYEGHVKLGKTANMGAITIPALTGIDAGKAATLLVQFDAAAYSSAGGTVDNGDDHMDVTIKGPGTIGDLVETTALVEVKNVWEWTRYSLIVYGATNETRITFGSEREVKCRLYLDNITVTRAKDENPEAPAPEALVTPLDKEIVNTSDPGLFDANSMVVAEGGTLTCSVRVNKAWTAETDCDWLTITTVRCGDADPSTVTGANNGASLSNGVATVKATGLPYVTTKVEVGRNSGGESRTGHIIIKSEGAEIEKVAVTQAAEGTSVTGIVITGLTENQIPEFAADATAETTFTVRADTDWTIEVPVAETWRSQYRRHGNRNADAQYRRRTRRFVHHPVGNEYGDDSPVAGTFGFSPSFRVVIPRNR